MKKESYCGFCERCRLDSPDFQEAVAKVSDYMDELPEFWRGQGLQEGADFPWFEFRRGLTWFQGRPVCPGCKESGGLAGCAIRRCAQERRQSHCYECADHDSCKHLFFV
ncbi:MAG: DUF3795 domain-containing protein [Desulfobaccales bacterium]